MFTGRILEGRSLSDGLHQAIEAKEGVTITEENKSQAQITIQNYFRMYPKLSGMTGTAKTQEKKSVKCTAWKLFKFQQTVHANVSISLILFSKTRR